MRTLPTLKSCLLAFFAVALLASLAIEAYGESGPYWATWLGMMMLSALLVLVGLSILIAMIVNPGFVVELRPIGSMPREIKRREVICWCVIASGMILAGIIFFWNSLFGLLRHIEAH